MWQEIKVGMCLNMYVILDVCIIFIPVVCRADCVLDLMTVASLPACGCRNVAESSGSL